MDIFTVLLLLVLEWYVISIDRKLDKLISLLGG